MITKVLPYIPSDAKEPLEILLNTYDFHLKIVAQRKSKRGDFRNTKPVPTITINNNLSKAQFLITLVHEIAHLVVYIHNPKAAAHGLEWKQTFKKLMLPFLHPAIFPSEILSPLAKHLINAKASTDSDTHLSQALIMHTHLKQSNGVFLSELNTNEVFYFHHRKFRVIKKIRTRYECLDINNHKMYLIKGNALIKKI